MKNKIIYIFTGILLIIGGSCTEWLETKPLDKMVLEDYWKSKNDVESTVLACYLAMQEDGYMERIILGGELRSDNVLVDIGRLQSTQNQVDINEANIHPKNDLLAWKNFYTVINYCNTVLKYAPGVMDIDPDYTSGYLRAHEAEALTIRALTYFYLVRIYGDIPYIDFPYTDDTQDFNIPKMSGESILNLLIDDLINAERYALKAWGDPEKQTSRITKNMVRALLADIYLWIGKYDECIAACDRILPDVVGPDEVINFDLATGAELRLIDNRIYKEASFEQLFVNNHSSESLFELAFNPQIQNNMIPELYGNQNNIGQLAASAATLIPFQDPAYKDDLRGYFSFVRDFSSNENQQGYFRIFKYTGQSFVVLSSGVDYLLRTTSIANMNWIFYRLADIYLMKAEALVERNTGSDLANAMALVNLTYLRSNPSAPSLLITNFPSQTAMQELVLEERHREFMFEGKRWFDLLRLARKEDSIGGKNNHPRMLQYVTRKYQYNADVVRSKLRYTDALYLPVSESELISNKALVQNPYYIH